MEEISEMSDSEWKKDQERVALLRKKYAEEEELQYRSTVEEMKAAKAAIDPNDPVTERRFFYAMVREQGLREQKTGITADMSCGCGFVKGRGKNCDYCKRWHDALYGGKNWVRYGFYSGFL